MTTHVLFLCPHSAGKSVIAATYFRAAAARLDLDATASVAGTDPDSDIMPNVRQALARQGFTITDTPRRVTGADIDLADLVISIGCDPIDIASDSITEWDTPTLSADFFGSMNTIHAHAEHLARSLR